jgi:hypothetical protein
MVFAAPVSGMLAALTAAVESGGSGSGGGNGEPSCAVVAGLIGALATSAGPGCGVGGADGEAVATSTGGGIAGVSGCGGFASGSNMAEPAVVVSVGNVGGTADGSCEALLSAGVSTGGAGFMATGWGLLVPPNHPRKPDRSTIAVPISTTAAKVMTAFVDRHQEPARKYSGTSVSRGCEALGAWAAIG